MRKKLRSIVLLIVAFIMTAGQIASAENVPKDVRKLGDVLIFKDKAPGGWSGSGNGELEVEGGMLPVDTSETYNNLPSLRFSITKNLDSWAKAQLAIRSWNAHDLSAYVPNGYIEFNIKGKDGGENIVVGAGDITHERYDENSNPLDSLEALKSIQDYTTITKEWQHVKVPIKDIVDSTSGFLANSVQTIVLKSGTVDPLTVWINDLKITSVDNEKSYAPIKVNQVGYLSSSEKYALVTGFEDELKADINTEFQVKNALNDSTVYTGKLSLVKDYDITDSGEKILKADFSSLTIPGSYYITVSAEGVEKSVKFKIGNDIYSSLLADSSRYFFYQRQGIELTAKNALLYSRQDATPQDSKAIFASDLNKVIDISKGWYDAGDRGKYVVNGALAVSEMFWAYEMFPNSFKDNQLNIPESGNGVADILDEARWEVEWILKMQDSESGGFYARVQSDTIPSELIVNSRIIRDKSGDTVDIKSTDDTACAAAILAHSYLIYKDIDPQLANQCLESAKNAWTFLENNPNNIVSPSGPYNVYDDSSDRLWGAASLFRATGDEKYNSYFKENYEKFAAKFENPDSYAHNWGNMWTTAFWSYLKSDKKDKNIEAWINSEFNIWLKNVTARYNDSPWKNTIGKINIDGEMKSDYFWGCNSDIMLVSNDAIIGSKLLGGYDKSIEDFAHSSLNWVLGVNPQQKSYVSGYGENSLQTTFSYIYSYDGKKGIPNGYLAGGPNSIEGKGISKFPGKCHFDSDLDWVSNENCLNWNASLVFATAFANNEGLEPVENAKTTVSYNVLNDWKSGATVNITIKNNTSSDIKGWNLTWDFLGDQTIASLWNGTYAQNGTTVSVKNLEWNKTIPANGSVTIGLNILYNESNKNPLSFKLNGEASNLE